jgi:hypothetical protein
LFGDSVGKSAEKGGAQMHGVMNAFAVIGAVVVVYGGVRVVANRRRYFSEMAQVASWRCECLEGVMFLGAWKRAPFYFSKEAAWKRLGR